MNLRNYIDIHKTPLNVIELTKEILIDVQANNQLLNIFDDDDNPLDQDEVNSMQLYVNELNTTNYNRLIELHAKLMGRMMRRYSGDEWYSDEMILTFFFDSIKISSKSYNVEYIPWKWPTFVLTAFDWTVGRYKNYSMADVHIPVEHKSEYNISYIDCDSNIGLNLTSIDNVIYDDITTLHDELPKLIEEYKLHNDDFNDAYRDIDILLIAKTKPKNSLNKYMRENKLDCSKCDEYIEHAIEEMADYFSIRQ